MQPTTDTTSKRFFLPTHPLTAGLVLLPLLLLWAGCAGSSGLATWSGGRTAVTATADDAGDEARLAPLDAEGVAHLRGQINDALAQMSQAQMQHDTLGIEVAMERAMFGIQRLVAHPELIDDPGMRALYRSVITAYEGFYGDAELIHEEAFGDIFTLRAEMFERMEDMPTPLGDPAAPLPAPVAPTTVVPLETNRLVQQSIAYLKRNPANHVYPWLRRAGTYFPMIEQVLREEGIPDELKYLAMIESGLNPKAISHAGAGGMWQFMPATGRSYGLERSQWVDDRMNPEKATRAAARHLRDLYRQFGDWHLSLAAYNAGSGRVRQAQRKFRKNKGRDARSFWDLYPYLPRETRNYVPMYIATVLVVSQPQAHGLTPGRPDAPLAYEQAYVDSMVDLATLAELAATDVTTIARFNPELRHGVTPPARYAVRVPVGTQALFTTAYASLPPERRMSMLTHKVRRGDALSKLAHSYGTTVSALREVNGIRGSRIYVGQTLRVPVAASAAVGGSTPTVRTVSSPAKDKKGATRTATTDGRTRVTYRIKRGDSLSKIAQRYGVRVTDLKRWNNLRSDRIHTGSRLTLYTSNSSQASNEGTWIRYRVRRGDNLTKIGQRYGVSVAKLKKWNKLRTDRIRVGQRLAIYRKG